MVSIFDSSILDQLSLEQVQTNTRADKTGLVSWLRVAVSRGLTMPVLRFLSTRQKVCGAASPLLGSSRPMSVTPSVCTPCQSSARRYVRKTRWAVGAEPELRLAERL